MVVRTRPLQRGNRVGVEGLDEVRVADVARPAYGGAERQTGRGLLDGRRTS